MRKGDMNYYVTIIKEIPPPNEWNILDKERGR